MTRAGRSVRSEPLPWPQRLSAPGPKRVLSIDGGGVRGALAIGFLEQLEAALRARYGRPDLVLSDYFDLIGGTSVGAILAVGLALGRSAQDVARTFEVMSGRLFGGAGFRLPLVQARYDPNRLHALLEEEFGQITLGSAPWKTGFGCIAKRIDTGSAWILTNCPGAKYWEGGPNRSAGTTPNRDYPVARVVQASAAAPFFFDLASIDISPTDRGVFFDGAMTPHGNPVLALAMTALIPAYGFKWRAGPDELMVVSVGTGAPRPRKTDWRDRRVLALLKALHALVSVAYDSGELGVSVMQWLGTSPQPWRINSEVGDLADSRPAGYPPLWRFVRYDAPLEADWLEGRLGRRYDPRRLGALSRLDDGRQAPELLEIGRQAGGLQIKPEHFPMGFAP